MNPERLHRLAERLSSVVRSSLRQMASSHGLKLVQLEALVYISLANRYSDTPAALTENTWASPRGLPVKRSVRCSAMDSSTNAPIFVTDACNASA